MLCLYPLRCLLLALHRGTYIYIYIYVYCIHNIYIYRSAMPKPPYIQGLVDLYSPLTSSFEHGSEVGARLRQFSKGCRSCAVGKNPTPTEKPQISEPRGPQKGKLKATTTTIIGMATSKAPKCNDRKKPKQGGVLGPGWVDSGAATHGSPFWYLGVWKRKGVLKGSKWIEGETRFGALRDMPSC